MILLRLGLHARSRVVYPEPEPVNPFGECIFFRITVGGFSASDAI